MRIIKTYTELSKLQTYEERFEYLSLNGKVGEDTFGFDRYLNQQLYKSKEWKTVRDEVILRDNGCDLGMEDYDIFGTIHVHHMNPLTSDDIINSTEYLLNPEYLICVSIDTHNAIHYGNKDYLERKKIITRTPNDHCPWKNKRRTNNA
jgi:hypothetical protein